MSSNKTIAKNSIFLYFRMFLTMGVGLYTSRLVLEALGVENYGIYGLVGGIVAMFAFINNAMSSATQRYLSFDIGKNDPVQLKKTFNATLNIHILISAIVFLLAETIGLWFINYKLNIPQDRMYAANWVYQFSIFTFILGIIQVPYNALLIAREHMNVYAYMSIIEVLLKLIIVFILLNFGNDKLILYAILTFIVSFITRMLYKLYCKKHFKESHYQFYYDKNYYKELASYSGWSLFGNIAAIARGQGSNILLNIFFGPIANAAYSLTILVQNIIGSFVGNFQTALNPQITKTYAKGDVKSSLNLMYKSSKFSFFAMLILVIPFLHNTEYIMQLWLGKVPKYAVQFIQLALIYSLIETISNPLMIGAQATGKIKWYQITIGSFIFLTLPLTWFVFKTFNNPIYVYYVLIGNSLFALLFRILFLRKIMGLDLKNYLKNVFIPITIVSTVLYLLLFYKNVIYVPIDNVFIQFIITSGILLTISIIVILILGLEKQERNYIKTIIKSKLKRR